MHLNVHKKKIKPVFFAFALFMGFLGFFCIPNQGICATKSNVIQNVVDRTNLEKRARKCAESGELDKALILYQEALQPNYIDYDNQRATALGAMIEIYKWQGKYEDALKIVEEHIRNNSQIKINYIERYEIMALINSRVGDSSAIRNHISFLKDEYRSNLPPHGYKTAVIAIISDILRLYDTIGDHDAGIAFIDEILAYFRTGKAGDPKPGRVDAEYLKVREAFEKDKAKGTRGRATKALIQSDYFPW